MPRSSKTPLLHQAVLTVSSLRCYQSFWLTDDFLFQKVLSQLGNEFNFEKATLNRMMTHKFLDMDRFDGSNLSRIFRCKFGTTYYYYFAADDASTPVYPILNEAFKRGS